jgi:hypothetical protein
MRSPHNLDSRPNRVRYRYIESIIADRIHLHTDFCWNAAAPVLNRARSLRTNMVEINMPDGAMEGIQNIVSSKVLKLYLLRVERN